MCDVGCGAGFPLLPLALARGDCTFLGVDATEKKVNFVRAASSLLALENCHAEHLRAEELCSSRRESFDVVTARAVAELSVLCEYCLPLLKKLRGQGINAEIFPETSKMKKQMGYADKKNIPFVALVGENEIANHLVTLKNMHDGTQESIPVDDLIDKLRNNK